MGCKNPTCQAKMDKLWPEQKAEFKKGGVVWVSEVSTGGRKLSDLWYGKILSIGASWEHRAIVQDTNPKSVYFGEKFSRPLASLRKKEEK